MIDHEADCWCDQELRIMLIRSAERLHNQTFDPVAQPDLEYDILRLPIATYFVHGATFKILSIPNFDAGKHVQHRLQVTPEIISQ